MKNTILKKLEALDDDSIVGIWNEYVSNINDPERYMFCMYELDDIAYNLTATQLLASLDDNFDINADYFIDGIYGLKSIECISDVVDLEELADYIDDHSEFLEEFAEYFE